MGGAWPVARAGKLRGDIRRAGERALRWAHLAYYELFHGPRGRGRPVPVTTWDAQYRSRHWDFLASAEELPRYGVIAGFIRSLPGLPSVLDIGCGQGQLLAVLGRSAVSHYHGIDVSQEAILQAQSRAGAGVTFEVANLMQWHAPSQFDVVVLNEVLYYVAHPALAVERYLDTVRDSGLIVISMFRHRNTRLIWRDLAERFTVFDAAEVKNRKGEVVDIKIVQRAPPAAAVA